ncbi:hypothetical protein JCGZ_01159 [Jatropha curcas]|uniref:Uncharacterized protein n=1 Tax=Jatropha curcas TaxID=180498 RepID=A0A067L3H6_JATCU|nr:hypothetical protein JCGZ_01159 [Jatropha curcas]
MQRRTPVPSCTPSGIQSSTPVRACAGLPERCMPQAVPSSTPVRACAGLPERYTPWTVQSRTPVPDKINALQDFQRVACPRPCRAARPCAHVQDFQRARPIYDSLGGGRGTRLDIDLMIHMKIVEKFGDTYRVIGAPAETTDEDIHAAADIEEDQPPPFPGFHSGAGTSGAGPSFQGTSTVSNDELFARMFSRMDMFDTRLTGMESMITDRFQSLKITQGSIDSRLDTLQSHYQGLATQL